MLTRILHNNPELCTFIEQLDLQLSAPQRRHAPAQIPATDDQAGSHGLFSEKAETTTNMPLKPEAPAKSPGASLNPRPGYMMPQALSGASLLQPAAIC